MRDETITGLPVQAPADHVGAGIDPDMEDDALARAARARFRSDGIGSIEPDQGMRSALGGDEELLAVRQNASVERLAAGAPPESGRLAITTERIFLLDGHAVTLATLEELDDVTLVTDRLLVMLTGGAGFTIKAPQPKLLRVELAAARASRTERQTAASSSPAPKLATDPSRL